MRITREKAEALLRETVSRVADGVQAALKRPAQQHEFDAFVSFAYNVGVAAFRSSTLLRKWNAGDTVGAAREFARWIRAGGQILEGLVYRRWDEALVYLGVLK
jgi:lysozyme